MKGIIFNLVEEVVTDAYGPETWDSLLDAAGLDGAYTSLGSYPDEHLFQLVGAASSALGAPPDDIVRTLGQGAIPILAERYPEFFAPHPGTRPFLLTLNEIIHAEVRKLYPDADLPVFDFEEVADDELILGYRSARKLCSLAEGFIIGTARHYGEDVAIDQPECMHRGDERCLIRCRFSASPVPT
jgi:hypothetical protein